jgi:hypothetical protein
MSLYDTLASFASVSIDLARLYAESADFSDSSSTYDDNDTKLVDNEIKLLASISAEFFRLVNPFIKPSRVFCLICKASAA